MQDKDMLREFYPFASNMPAEASSMLRLKRCPRYGRPQPLTSAKRQDLRALPKTPTPWRSPILA
jgi:hypothetical protein